MDINQINVNQIVSVNSYNKAICTDFEYSENERFLFVKLKDGFYRTWAEGFWPKSVPVEEIEKNGKRICRDKVVYYKPHIDIRTSNGGLYTQYFESSEKLKEFMETDKMKSVNWIQIN